MQQQSSLRCLNRGIAGVLELSDAKPLRRLDSGRRLSRGRLLPYGVVLLVVLEDVVSDVVELVEVSVVLESVGALGSLSVAL